MTSFTPLPALLGGLLIGAAAVVLLLFNGRIMGVSGIAAGLLQARRSDVLWRVLFLAALVCSPVLYAGVTKAAVHIQITGSLSALVIGGFLVGLGACTANGCTSGHGVCGLGRLSPRSLAATLTFMATSIATVYVMRHMAGGAS